jgi:hypothetical protein
MTPDFSDFTEWYGTFLLGRKLASKVAGEVSKRENAPCFEGAFKSFTVQAKP